MEDNLRSISTFTSTESLDKISFSPQDPSLLAIGGSSHLTLLQYHSTSSPPSLTSKVLATWYLSSPITSLAWSPLSQIKLLVSTSNSLLLILSYEESEGPRMRKLDRKEGGHKGRIWDVDWCTVKGMENVVGSVGDDCCFLWNLDNEEDSILVRLSPPSCYPNPNLHGKVPHPSPLRSVAFHPQIASQVLTTDNRGTSRIIDFNQWFNPRVKITLHEPRNLSRKGKGGGMAHAAWNPVEKNVVGGIINGRYAVWDLDRLSGGRPLAVGEAFASFESSRQLFRWHPTDRRLFAVSSSHPRSHPSIKIYYTSYPQVPRNLFLAPPPKELKDMVWHPTEEVLAVVVGNEVNLYRLNGNED